MKESKQVVIQCALPRAHLFVPQVVHHAFPPQLLAGVIQNCSVGHAGLKCQLNLNANHKPPYAHRSTNVLHRYLDGLADNF